MLIILSFILIHLKQVYYVLILLFLLIPAGKFKSAKQKYQYGIFVTGAGIVSYVLWSLTLRLRVGTLMNSGGYAGEQIEFILSDPLRYAGVLLNSMYVNREYYFQSFIGNLGWLDTSFPVTFLLIYAVILVLSFLYDESPIQINFMHKSALFLVGLFALILVQTALYIIWTSIPEIGGVGSDVISGVQGRYFIPIAPLLFIFFQRSFRKNIDLSRYLVSFSTFSLGFTLLLILVRYWV